LLTDSTIAIAIAYFSRPRNPGLTLEELAHVLVDNGARYAINMDGGGSSTMVMMVDADADDADDADDAYEETAYRVINRPTCLDVPIVVCERPVATVLCVRSSSSSMAIIPT
jgi:hypothetical protein